MKALVFTLFLLQSVPFAEAKQSGDANVSNEKMCVCEPCGGKAVSCRETKGAYVAPDVKPQAPAKPDRANSASDQQPQ